MQNQASKANPNEFPESPRVRPEIKELPASDDEDFWGKDADITLIHKDQIARHTPSCGSFKQRGQFVICGTCPHEHTVPGFTLNHEGKLVKLDK